VAHTVFLHDFHQHRLGDYDGLKNSRSNKLIIALGRAKKIVPPGQNFVERSVVPWKLR
jgi:hypothetical protein